MLKTKNKSSYVPRPRLSAATTVTSVTTGGVSGADWHFNKNVTLTNGLDCASMVIDAAGPTLVATLSASVLRATYSVAPGDGSAWSVAVKPNGVTVPGTFAAASGTI